MKSILKNKKAQASFEMSFSMIFSIILIVVFIAAAFVGIRAFLNYQKTIQISIFLQGLQQEVDNAWNAGDSSTLYKGYLPSGIEYVCFINWTGQTIAANNVEQKIYSDLKKGSQSINSDQNFYIYAPTKNYAIKAKTIKHIDLTSHNPVCVKVMNNYALVKVNKRFESPLVQVSE